MHSHIEIYFKENIKCEPQEVVLEKITKILNRYEKELGSDWFMIGGRWKGAHVESYSIKNDPKNNGLWPTNFQSHEDDIIDVRLIPDDLNCYALIVENVIFIDEKNGIKVKDVLQHFSDGYLVTVDIHS